MAASHRTRSAPSGPLETRPPEPPPVAPPPASNSGKWTSPNPRSVRGSRAHRSAITRVWASSRRASRSLSPSPDNRQISSAISCICLPDLRKPSALPRSRWRRSSATRRRAASRTSTTGASRRSAYRTALVSTAPTPARRAIPAIRAACWEVPGPQTRSCARTRWETSSSRRFSAGTNSRQRPSAASARSSRRRVAAIPTSEAGPRSTTTSPLCRCGASRVRSATGRPLSPASWVAETSRQIAAQPARPPAEPACARRVTRGSTGSRKAPPLTGLLGRLLRLGSPEFAGSTGA